MSRSSASLSLPREPDFLQHVPAIHEPNEPLVLKIQTKHNPITDSAKRKQSRRKRTSSSRLCGLRESQRQTRRGRSAPWSRSDPSATPSSSQSNCNKPISHRMNFTLRTPATAPKPFPNAVRAFYIASAAESRARLTFSEFSHHWRVSAINVVVLRLHSILSHTHSRSAVMIAIMWNHAA